MTQDAQEIMARLREPFATADIEWRVQRVMQTSRGNKAIVLAYITARAVMERLDEVFGIDGWTDSYERWGESGVLCTISCRINGEWISRTDGADDTNIEATKGGISDSFKRAAVKWGIGRYLYRLDESWVDIKERGEHYISTEVGRGNQKTRIQGYWDTPQMPSWALPGGGNGASVKPPASTQPRPQEPPKPPAQGNGNGNGRQQNGTWQMSEAQRRRLFAIANGAGVDVDGVRSLVQSVSGQESTAALTREQYDTICEMLQAQAQEQASS